MEIRQESFPWPKYFTMFFATISIFIVNFIYLHDPWLHPEDYPRHYAIFFSVLFTSLGLIWSWAYIITICTLKKPPKSSKIGKNEGHCIKCRIDKPERTHHCSSCGICVEKMDHHCIWTDRCIGYRNYKAFWQFIGTLSLGTYVYDYLAICFFLREAGHISIFLIFLAYIHTAIAFLATFLCTSLFIAHSMMISVNLSTIEYMKGKPFRYCWKEEDEIRNIHDLGFIQNWIQVIGSNPLMWLVPRLVREREDGVFFPHVPVSDQLKQIKTVSS